MTMLAFCLGALLAAACCLAARRRGADALPAVLAETLPAAEKAPRGGAGAQPAHAAKNRPSCGTRAFLRRIVPLLVLLGVIAAARGGLPAAAALAQKAAPCPVLPPGALAEMRWAVRCRHRFPNDLT